MTTMTQAQKAKTAIRTVTAIGLNCPHCMADIADENGTLMFEAASSELDGRVRPCFECGLPVRYPRAPK